MRTSNPEGNDQVTFGRNIRGSRDQPGPLATFSNKTCWNMLLFRRCLVATYESVGEILAAQKAKKRQGTELGWRTRAQGSGLQLDAQNKRPRCCNSVQLYPLCPLLLLSRRNDIQTTS